jgi:hypothetical protein
LLSWLIRCADVSSGAIESNWNTDASENRTSGEDKKIGASSQCD